MSIALGALIASCSLVLSGVVLGGILTGADLAVGLALIPAGLTLLSAIGVICFRRHCRRQQLTLRPGLWSMLVWSVVGVPVLGLGSHLIPYLLAFGAEYSQAGIAVLGIALTFNGLWIAPLLALVVAAGIRLRDRKAQDH